MKWVMFKFWAQMFRPSSIRLAMDEEFANRPRVEAQSWRLPIDPEFAETILRLIESAGEWPEGKLRNTDPLLPVFHGKADSVMAFSRFAAAIQRVFNIKITLQAILTEIDVERATIEDFVAALSAVYQKER